MPIFVPAYTRSNGKRVQRHIRKAPSTQIIRNMRKFEKKGTDQQRLNALEKKITRSLMSVKHGDSRRFNEVRNRRRRVQDRRRRLLVFGF